jgi:hypothetical protein
MKLKPFINQTLEQMYSAIITLGVVGGLLFLMFLVNGKIAF